MITALDTNVFVALWDSDDDLSSTALDALDSAYDSGGLVICGAVFAELMAFPQRNEEFLVDFLNDTRITVDWAMDETIWNSAGRAYRMYADRRRKQGPDGPRRILADFMIGSHALAKGYGLLTLDAGIYRAAFPALKIIKF